MANGDTFAPISNAPASSRLTCVVEHHVTGDHVDVALGTLQRLVQELRAGAGCLQQIGDQRTGFMHDVRRGCADSGAGLTADMMPAADPGLHVVGGGVGQSAQCTKPHPGTAEAHLCAGLILPEILDVVRANPDSR
jgi:hypothetical protein